MSQLIFPSFQSPNWSFTWPIKQTPVFNTIIQTPATKRGELRISTTQFPLWQFVLDISYLKGDAQGSATAWQNLVNFYIAVQGQASDWLFLHPYDNQVTAQAIGTGDGTTVAFTIFRSLIASGAQDLIQNFVSAPQIFINGVVQSGSSYTIDQYGTLTFNSAPGAGTTISWTGQFYYRCRFLADQWDNLSEDLFQIWSNSELKFISVLL